MKRFSMIMSAMLMSLTMACCSCAETDEVSKESSITSVEEKNDTINIDALKKNDGVMLSVTRKPGASMTQEEFEEKTTEYTVYYSGNITMSKSDKTAQLSDSDYNAIYSFTDKLCKGTLSAPETNMGADMPTFDVKAYDTEEKEYQQNIDSETVQEFESVYPLIEAYFN